MRGAPKLTRRLELEDPVKTADSAGGYATSWTVLGELWADVRFKFGRGREEAGVGISQSRVDVVVHAAPEGAPSRPKPGQRFTEGSRHYIIEAVGELTSDARYLRCITELEAGK